MKKSRVLPSAQTSIRGSGQKRISQKIDTLIGEGTPQKQAVAMAYSMERAGRLTAGGGYKRVGKKRGG
jgi:hypothetical protein